MAAVLYLAVCGLVLREVCAAQWPVRESVF